MPVDELPAAEVVQERPGAIDSGRGVDERSMLAELLQQPKPAGGVIALKQGVHGLIDLRDRLAVVGVKQRVGVREEVLSFSRHGREAGEPAHAIGREALQVSLLTATLSPMVPERLVLTRDGPGAETVRG